jgi:hypothetical protein
MEYNDYANSMLVLSLLAFCSIMLVPSVLNKFLNAFDRGIEKGFKLTGLFSIIAMNVITVIFLYGVLSNVN